MSRIGKQQIQIPAGTLVTMEPKLDVVTLTVKGPKGVLVRDFLKTINIKNENSIITLEPLKKDDISFSALWGTYGAHIKNMIKGVNEMFQKKLIIEGVGFKSDVKDGKLVMALGFSHPVIVDIPKELVVIAEKNVLTITGIDKEFVGYFCAKVRSLKKPEPYKGKGIRYSDEVIRRKQGKKAA